MRRAVASLAIAGALAAACAPQGSAHTSPPSAASRRAAVRAEYAEQLAEIEDYRACAARWVEDECARALTRLRSRCSQGRERACQLALHAADANAARLCAEHGMAVCEAACDSGDGAACFRLGLLYIGGERVPQDMTRWMTLTERACSLGATSACAYVEPRCEHGSCKNALGRAIAVDVGIAHYRRKCASGTAVAPCATLLELLRAHPSLAEVGEDVTVMRRLCRADTDLEHRSYCGRLRDRGIAP